MKGIILCYSGCMDKYIARIADNTIKKYLETFGAVIIEGARASGKTTTSKNAAKSFISLDKSPALVALAEADPSAVFSGETPRLIDEWQLAPSIWNAVRHEVFNRVGPLYILHVWRLSQRFGTSSVV